MLNDEIKICEGENYILECARLRVIDEATGGNTADCLAIYEVTADITAECLADLKPKFDKLVDKDKDHVLLDKFGILTEVINRNYYRIRED
jgi:hypothetical protein